MNFNHVVGMGKKAYQKLSLRIALEEQGVDTLHHFSTNHEFINATIGYIDSIKANDSDHLRTCRLLESAASLATEPKDYYKVACAMEELAYRSSNQSYNKSCEIITRIARFVLPNINRIEQGRDTEVSIRPFNGRDYSYAYSSLLIKHFNTLPHVEKAQNARFLTDLSETIANMPICNKIDRNHYTTQHVRLMCTLAKNGFLKEGTTVLNASVLPNLKQYPAFNSVEVGWDPQNMMLVIHGNRAVSQNNLDDPDQPTFVRQGYNYMASYGRDNKPTYLEILTNSQQKFLPKKIREMLRDKAEWQVSPIGAVLSQISRTEHKPGDDHKYK